jgi:hypothetical protein
MNAQIIIRKHKAVFIANPFDNFILNVEIISQQVLTKSRNLPFSHCGTLHNI